MLALGVDYLSDYQMNDLFYALIININNNINHEQFNYNQILLCNRKHILLTINNTIVVPLSLQ